MGDSKVQDIGLAEFGQKELTLASMRYQKQRIQVLGKSMAYVEVGKGNPIVFVHGNPTSSYMWRNVLPHCEGLGCRLIAPDLIGMGDSEKLPAETSGKDHRYSVPEQYRFFSALMEALGVNSNVTLVCHSWGGVIGSHWANEHRDAMRGFVTLEAPLMPFSSWSSMPFRLRLVFRLIKSCLGYHLVVRKNIMIEKAIPGGVIRTLTAEEHDEYRRPFLEGGEARRPLLCFARTVPIQGDRHSVNVVRMMEKAREYLKTSPIPKLLLAGDPGSSLTEEEKHLLRTWENFTEVSVKGKHLITEDSPQEVGDAITKWFKETFIDK
eukprot:TRINITY_DN42356_c0_g1_i1.p1 TRINITY_DN42356_c0_g1~~TRINITY_DN42356_c0_g1_i1.p1  ORF type:complete len:322 (-),score=25.94 TRINITY_DN42356_c0_g1_i1:170-1135(-)